MGEVRLSSWTLNPASRHPLHPPIALRPQHDPAPVIVVVLPAVAILGCPHAGDARDHARYGFAFAVQFTVLNLLGAEGEEFEGAREVRAIVVVFGGGGGSGDEVEGFGRVLGRRFC